ncbi:MAG: uroporphyrinogen-III synthase [Phycisphaerales bacterium]|nr:MAG: uroporphyrinogen-III synthase [Phycisphaerales bacterium]
MKVWVTREETNDGPLCAALRAVGLEPVLEPALERRVVTDAADEISRLGPGDWLVLTSTYAVNAVAAEPARVPRVAVVAESSRAAAQARGFRVELVSRDGTGKSLFDQLRSEITTGKVCFPRSALVEPPKGWPGVELLSPVLYETVSRAFDRNVIKSVDVVSVASASAVEAVGKVDLPFASIGPSTSKALRDLGIDPWVEAPQRSFESLAAAIAGQANDSRHQRA